MLSHSLPPLEYGYDAFEPHIDALTMEIHHSKHHQAYITNYSKLLDGTGLIEKYSPLELLEHLDEVSTEKKQGVINNLGWHINHSFFWTILTPNSEPITRDSLYDALESTFWGVEWFQEQFTAKALSVFGSGWAWLCRDAQKNLVVMTTPGQNSPLSEWLTPIIGLDVWEHAYYLKHQNKRADYIASFWNVVSWKQAQENFDS